MYKRMFVGTEKKKRLQKVIRVVLPLRRPVNSALLSLAGFQVLLESAPCSYRLRKLKSAGRLPWEARACLQGGLGAA